MKMSLLTMTQNILSAMDSDEVNSITDTTEALQVATVIRETYYEITSGLNEPSFEGLVTLDPLNSLVRPNYMRIPEAVKNIKWIKYDYLTNGHTDYHDIRFLPPEDFLTMTNSRGAQGAVQSVPDFSTGRLVVKTDHSPTYWTTFDNQYIVFDSYDLSAETTLQQSRILCWGQFVPDFQMLDTFIPLLDADMFPQLLAEAKSSCFINFKQVSNSKAEQQAKRQRVRRQNDLWRADQRTPYNRTPDFGRKRPG